MKRQIYEIVTGTLSGFAFCGGALLFIWVLGLVLPGPKQPTQLDRIEAAISAMREETVR